MDTQQMLIMINDDVREKISTSLFSNSRVGIFVNTEVILQEEADRLFGKGIFKVQQRDQYSFDMILTEYGKDYYEKLYGEIQVSAPSED